MWVIVYPCAFGMRELVRRFATSLGEMRRPAGPTVAPDGGAGRLRYAQRIKSRSTAPKCPILDGSAGGRSSCVWLFSCSAVLRMLRPLYGHLIAVKTVT